MCMCGFKGDGVLKILYSKMIEKSLFFFLEYIKIFICLYSIVCLVDMFILLIVLIKVNKICIKFV